MDMQLTLLVASFWGGDESDTYKRSHPVTETTPVLVHVYLDVAKHFSTSSSLLKSGEMRQCVVWRFSEANG